MTPTFQQIDVLNDVRYDRFMPESMRHIVTVTLNSKYTSIDDPLGSDEFSKIISWIYENTVGLWSFSMNSVIKAHSDPAVTSFLISTTLDFSFSDLESATLFRLTF